MKGSNKATTLILFASIWLAPVSNAGVLLFDIDSDPAAWSAAVAGLASSTAYNFDIDADYGLVEFPGPLTTAGGGPVSPDAVSDGVVISRIDNGGTNDFLVAVGPSNVEVDNTSNAVFNGFFEDGLNISFATGVMAFAFNALTSFGGNTVDLTVHDTLGGLTSFEGIGVGSGHNWGILGTAGIMFDSVDLFDTERGAEGIQGLGTIYRRGAATTVPAPATLALFGLGLAGLGWSRRKQA